MAQRKIQLLRSTTVYDSKETAMASLNLTFAETAGLKDGEVVLARYYAQEQKIGGGSDTVVRSVLGIFNDKSEIKHFTYITDQTDVNEMIEAIWTQLRSLDFTEVNGVVTQLSQEDGTISADTTDVKDLELDGYVKTNDTGNIADGDTLEVAFSKLENAIDTVDVDIHSTDETITVTPDATGKNLEVNIDGLTIVQDPTLKTLKTNLQINKITTGLEANVKEAYRLQDNGGNTYGQQINVYKDSALKEVYIGSEYDTIDTQTGEVRKIAYEAAVNWLFIEDDDYSKLSVTEQSLYTATTRNVYNINAITISDAAYQQLDPSVQELYVAMDEVTWMVNPLYETIYDDTYNELTAAQQAAYTATTQSGYQLNNRYLTDDEFNDIYGGGAVNTIYRRLGSSSIGVPNKDYYQSLNFVYYLADGTYELVKVDISKFLTENEFGNGLMYVDHTIAVFAGDGLDFGGGNPGRKPLVVKIDPTSNSALTVSQDGIKLDLTDITDNQLNSVTSGNNGITVSEKTNNEQEISLQLSETVLTNATDAQYAGETVEEEVGGETVVTDVHNNILQIKNDGLYLDSTWDCGEY